MTEKSIIFFGFAVGIIISAIAGHISSSGQDLFAEDSLFLLQGKFEWLAGQCPPTQKLRLDAMPGRHSLELSRSQDVVGALGEFPLCRC